MSPFEIEEFVSTHVRPELSSTVLPSDRHPQRDGRFHVDVNKADELMTSKASVDDTGVAYAPTDPRVPPEPRGSASS